MSNTAKAHVTRAEIESFVQEWADRERLGPVSIVWDPGVAHGRTIATRKGHQITLGTGLLSDPEVASVTVAHELGHVACGHFGSWVHHWIGILGVSTLCVNLLFDATVVMHEVRARHWAAWARVTAVVGAALIGMLMAVVVAGAVAYLLARHEQHFEIEADAWAAEHGYPLTRAMVDEAIAQEQSEALHWWQAWWPSHPSWETRFQHPANQAALERVASQVPGRDR